MWHFFWYICCHVIAKNFFFPLIFFFWLWGSVILKVLLINHSRTHSLFLGRTYNFASSSTLCPLNELFQLSTEKFSRAPPLQAPRSRLRMTMQFETLTAAEFLKLPMKISITINTRKTRGNNARDPTGRCGRAQSCEAVKVVTNRW